MKRLIILSLLLSVFLMGCSCQAIETKDESPTPTDTTILVEEKVEVPHIAIESDDIDFSALTYKASEGEANAAIEKAVKDYYADDELASYPYLYQYIDLNNDGTNEAVVLLGGINFAGSGGQTMLVMKFENKEWSTFSRSTLANQPIIISDSMTNGYKDIVLYVSGGGAEGNYHTLKYDGTSYPLNPSTQDIVSDKSVAGTAIMSEETIEYLTSQ